MQTFQTKKLKLKSNFKRIWKSLIFSTKKKPCPGLGFINVQSTRVDASNIGLLWWLKSAFMALSHTLLHAIYWMHTVNIKELCGNVSNLKKSFVSERNFPFVHASEWREKNCVNSSKWTWDVGHLWAWGAFNACLISSAAAI